MRGRVIVALALVGCEAAPARLPQASIERIESVEGDGTRVLLADGARRHGWLAQVDGGGRPRWVRPVPDALTLPDGSHDAELVGDGQHGALQIVAHTEGDAVVEHLLGFSRVEGTPRWHIRTELGPGSLWRREIGSVVALLACGEPRFCGLRRRDGRRGEVSGRPGAPRRPDRRLPAAAGVSGRASSGARAHASSRRR